MRLNNFNLRSDRCGLLTFGTWLCLSLGASTTTAQEAVQPARYAIEQPSQNLADALRSIARQTNTSILFEPQSVLGRMAPPVSGKLSAIEAIRVALRGTSLTANVMGDGAIVVTAPAHTKPLPAGSAPSSTRASDAAYLLAANELGSADRAEPDASTRGPAQELARIEITGSRLARIDAEGPAPVNVYTRRDIEASGQPNLQRFLASLSEVSASTGEGGFGTTLGQGTVQLRGLPLGSTLVLINGRRVQAVGSSTGSVFNLNLIPSAAIERVEVVPLGSSAVYGGDALAGVVNVILKKDMDGQSLTARVGSGRGLSDASISLATGAHGAEGSYLLMGTYSRSSPLSMLDRAFFRDADYRRFGGVDARMNYCTPGTVSSLDGANLPGLDSPVAGIPSVPQGQALRASDFQSSSGKENLCNVWTTGGGVALIHGTENLAFHSLAERQISASWSAFGEATVVADRTRAKDIGLVLDGVTVPAQNLFNPFGVDVSVTAVLGPDNGVQHLSRRSRFMRALAGVKGDITKDWDAEFTVSTSRDRNTTTTTGDHADDASLAAALNSPTANGALNPFTAGRAASDAVLKGIFADTPRYDRGRKDQVSGLLRGPIADLWAGPVDTVIGAESARDRYDVSIPDQSTEIHGSRSSSAMFGELRAPLIRAPGEGGWSMAALTLAGRHDHYSDFGSASTYQGGLELRPARNLLIRGSVANSFKPPSIMQMNVGDYTYNAAPFQLKDPARSGERITSGTVVRTTNTALAPEHGQARGIGAVWEPEAHLGARVSATYWQLSIRGMIAVLRPQTALDYEGLFPGFVTRAPSSDGLPGVVTSVKTTEVNYGRLDTSGTDIDLAYAWKTNAGRVTVSLGGTQTREYRVVVAPGAPSVDRLGRRYADFWAPRKKGRLSIGLESAGWNLGLASHYLGAYKDAGISDRRLGGYWMHEVTGSLDLKKLWPAVFPGFKAATFGLGINNLLDREPQYVDGAPFYDVTQADWRGRYVNARLSLDW